LWGPARIIAIINNGNDIKHLILDSFVSFHFCALAVVMHFAPIRFYKQTTLRTEAFTQSSFYAQIFLHREVSAQKTFVHKRLYTQRFLRKEGSIYTILHTDAVYKDAFARINKGT